MAIGTSTDMFGEKSVATELITIKGAGGSSSGSGQFIGTDFDSGWIPEQPLNGCYISSEDYHLRVNTGHYRRNITVVLIFVFVRIPIAIRLLLGRSFKYRVGGDIAYIRHNEGNHRTVWIPYCHSGNGPA